MNNKRNLCSDFVNTLLIIRMNSLFLKQYGKNTHDFINDDLLKLFKEDIKEEDLNFRSDPLLFNKLLFAFFNQILLFYYEFYLILKQ